MAGVRATNIDCIIPLYPSFLTTAGTYYYVPENQICCMSVCSSGRNTFGTFMGGNGTENTARRISSQQLWTVLWTALYLSSIFFIFSQKRKGKQNSSMFYIDSYNVCLHWGRYLLVWPDISAQIYTRCAWAGGTLCGFPDFVIIISFMLFTLLCFLLFIYFISKNFWFTIHMNSWFWRIIDQICWACAIFRWIPNLQACTNSQTDRRTHRRINLGGLTG